MCICSYLILGSDSKSGSTNRVAQADPITNTEISNSEPQTNDKFIERQKIKRNEFLLRLFFLM